MSLLLIAMLVMLTACASWQSPRAPGEHYYCKPDSAIRYRGRVDERHVVVRPAAPRGSCRHN